MEPDTKEAQQHLAAAVEAARRHDAKGFVLGIAESHALDGITRGLISRWPGVEPGLVEAVVAEAVDALYIKVAEDGGVVTSPGGYLWGAAQNILRKRYHAGTVETIPFVHGKHAPTYDPREELSEDRNDEALHRTAIQKARSLLPRLGGEIVIKVMTFILDALEQGDVYIDNAMIAEALGLTLPTVRRSKWRGFQRLHREARKEGIDVPETLEITDDTNDQDFEA